MISITDDDSFPPQGNQIQKPSLDTVYEGETPDGTLNKSINETELELQLVETSPAPHEALISRQSHRSDSNTDRDTHGDAGLILDLEGQTRQGYIQTQRQGRKSEVREEIYTCTTDGEEHGYKERMGNTAGFESNRDGQRQAYEKERHQANPGKKILMSECTKKEQGRVQMVSLQSYM
ncbi:hypothetical protein OS493_025693 [Desmophyllum pertusum]|uniref:Uncharacterized protein n=1 Tax=Desmophyllum pertusum TaxID=174260 RepID=A0A9W9ZLB2_9CNID|nr:hypothetical protein OS493_025693 [Desmophyllum pertusum]